MPTVQDERIAELVVQRRLLTPAQVSECQQLQSQSPTPCTLAQVIVSRRYATAEALRALALGPGQTHAGGSTASSPGLPPGGARPPTGSFPRAGVSSSQAGQRPTGFFPTGAPAPAAGGDDPEVAFGRFLIAEGLLDAEQAREGYKLLTGYRQQFPQVNLSQVLAKHGMCDKEALRSAYQRFMAQREAAPARRADDMVTLDAPPPVASSTSAGAPWGGAGSGAEPRFGFKTVELDPQERPDYAASGPPGGGAMLSPFAAPAGTPAPALDPGTLDDFLPIDSAPQHAPPRFVESETLIDRGRATGGAFAKASAYPGPARTGPGATAGESRWTSETGPNGTHAGPRGTHRQRLGTDAGAALMPPAQPVQLPPPIQLKPDLDEPDDEDEDEEDDAPEVAAKAPGKKRRAGDTDIQSSTFGAAKKRRAAPATKSGPPMPVIAAVAGGVVLVLSIGLWMLAQRMELKSAKRDFLLAVGTEPAEVMLDRHKALPTGLLDDPEIVAAHQKLEAEVQRLRARKLAEEELAKLPAAKTLAERLDICSRAIDADDSFATAWVARGRVRLALARKKALERGGQGGNVTTEAMQDVDQAIVRDPSSALAYLVKAQLYLVNASQPDARQKAQSSLQNVMSQDPEGPLGALAQGLLEHLKRDWDKAIQHFDRAINLDPKLLDAYLLRADARLRKRDYPKALSDAAAATRMDPSSSEALTLQAEARYFSTRDASNRSGDRAGALADLDRALDLDPSNGRALALRAYARLERDRIGDVVSTQDDQEQARRDAERAVLVDPDQPLAHLALAEIEQAQQRTGDALRHASHAVERGRHLPMVYLVRGRLRARDGDVEQAKQDFNEVERLEPGNARALTNKAAVLIKQNDFDSARSYLDRAITSDPELSEAYFQRGLIHLKSRPRQYQLAIDDLSKAIELKAQFPDAYFYRACAFSYQSQWDQCIDDLKKAEAQRRDDGAFNLRDVHLLRGHCHYQKREWREAQEAYETYQKMAPPGSRPLDKVNRRLGQVRQALAGEQVELDDESSELDEPSR